MRSREQLIERWRRTFLLVALTLFFMWIIVHLGGCTWRGEVGQPVVVQPVVVQPDVVVVEPGQRVVRPIITK